MSLSFVRAGEYGQGWGSGVGVRRGGLGRGLGRGETAAEVLSQSFACAVQAQPGGRFLVELSGAVLV